MNPWIDECSMAGVMSKITMRLSLCLIILCFGAFDFDKLIGLNEAKSELEPPLDAQLLRLYTSIVSNCALSVCDLSNLKFQAQNSSFVFPYNSSSQGIRQ